MARVYAEERDGWALAKRGKAAKAIKVEATGDGVPLGTQRDLGCAYEPVTASRQVFRAWVASLQKINQGDNPALSDILKWNVGRLENEGHTTRTTAVRYARLVEFFGEHLGVKDLSVQRCKDYARHMEAEGYAANTIWGDLNVLRSAIKKAYQYDEIDAPTHDRLWNIAKPEGRQNHLTPAQFWSWYDAATSAHLRLFLLIGLLTGQRHEAICELRWEHVDFDAGVIDFRKGKREKRSVLDKGYQKERAVVHMGDTLRAHLLVARQTAQTAYVIEYQGRPILGHTGCADGCRAAREAAGLPEWVVPHILRHTAATWAEDEGIDIETVAQMTGHRDKRVLESIYLHRSGKGSQAAVEAVEKRLGGKLRVVK